MLDQVSPGSVVGRASVWTASGPDTEYEVRSTRSCRLRYDVGSVAPLPTTRSFVLPMFTRMPVRNIVSTMFERP